MTPDEARWLQLERAVGLGAPVYTRLEVSERAGAPFETARRPSRALGFPDAEDDDRIFTEADAEKLRMATALVEEGAVAPEGAVKLTRVLVQSLARVADAEASSLEQAVAAEAALLTEAVKDLHPTLEAFLT